MKRTAANSHPQHGVDTWQTANDLSELCLLGFVMAVAGTCYDNHAVSKPKLPKGLSGKLLVALCPAAR